MTDNTLFSTLLMQAQYYLAKRDHACSELETKLKQYIVKKQNQQGSPHNKAKYAKKAVDELDDFDNADYAFSKALFSLPEATLETIDAVINYCKAQKWLNDAEFTRKYIHFRHKKGIGKNKLKQELYHKGLHKDLIQSALNSADIDWYQLAFETAEKKFNDQLLDKSPENRAKIQRFLQARGFNFDEIYEALQYKA